MVTGRKSAWTSPRILEAIFSPVFETEEIPLNGHLLHFHFDSDIHRRGDGRGKNDDLSMNRTEFRSFEERNTMTAQAPRGDPHPVQPDGKIGDL